MNPVLRGAPMVEAVEAATDGLLEVAALLSPVSCDTSAGYLVEARPLASDKAMSSKKKFVEGNQWHTMKFVLCVRSTSEFDTVSYVFNELEEFVPV